MKKILTLLCLFVLPLSLAQTTDAPAAFNIPFFLQGLWATLLTSAATMGVAGINSARAWLRQRVAASKIGVFKEAMLALENAAGAKVVELYNDAIEAIKNASSDGKLSVEEIRAVVDTAIAEISAGLSSWVKNALLAGVGNNTADLDELIIKPVIEQAVKQAKYEGLAAKSMKQSNLNIKELSDEAQRKAADRLKLAYQRINLQ